MDFPATAAIFTIGCRLNQADSALLCGRLEQRNCRIVDINSEPPAELVIVNTCTVTGTAAQKSRQAVRKFRKANPQCLIVVTGCSAEIENSFWKNEKNVDLVLPNPEKKNLVAHLEQLLAGRAGTARMNFSPECGGEPVFFERASARFPFRSRAFLKVQEGCDNFCTYCIVPYARGRERSRAWDEVIADFRQLADSGYHEIVLTGVNISAYEDHGRKLVDLLRELCGLPGEFRLRLSSAEPHPENMNLLDVMERNPKICRFLHLSLQHGADRILQAMNRKYTTGEYARFIAEARRRIPGIHLGTDIIVGFPGETDELFGQSCEFVRRMNFANIHLFTYSPRAGTPAATFPGQVPAEVARRRYAALKTIADKAKAAFAESQIGKDLEVLFERRRKNGFLEGWSDNYIAVKCAAAGLRKNVLSTVHCTAATPDGCLIAD